VAPAAPVLTGLTSAEVAQRVARGETNNFHPRVGRTYFDIFRDNVFNVFTVTMLIMLTIVLLFGDYSTVFFAGFSVFTNALFGTIQEVYSKRKFDSLMAMAAPLQKVWRDGVLTEISVYDVVKDDVLPIEPGDKIVADGTVLVSDALEMDESQLTGESDAVLKEAEHKVSSGSFCIAGSGIMRADVVGEHSTVNKLTTVAKAYRFVLTPTQRRINTLVQLSIFIMLVCTPMLFVAGYMQHGEIVDLRNFQNAVIFIASVVPQGLVLTATLSLTIGAIVISRRETLVQRVNAVESMGNVTTLCFDKTGTLTQNKLSVFQLKRVNIEEGALKDSLRLFISNLSSLNRTAGAIGLDVGWEKGQAPSIVKTREIAFSSARKWSAVIFNDHTLILGAPERVLTEAEFELADEAREMASRGYRVVAFSRADGPFTGSDLPENRRTLALVVLADTTRTDMKETLDAFTAQGVELKVISGDNLETVREVATQAGMKIRQAFTGDQLAAMSEIEFAEAAREGNLFARIEPDQKRQLVAALKKAGEYVAMTGDGVNDVPSLKEAHLAIAMNDGAQITKDVADIVLLNNALTTLPEAFFEGRTITQIIFGTSKIFLVKNVYSLLFFLFVGFMFLPFPVTPIQISWLTFGVINLTAGLMSFRLYMPAPMQYFRRDVLDYVVTTGALGAVSATLVYAVVTFLRGGGDPGMMSARSTVVVFLTLIGLMSFWDVCGISMLRPNTWLTNKRPFYLGLIAAPVTIIAGYLLPELGSFIPLSLAEWAVALGVFAVVVVLNDVATRTRYFSNLLWRLTAAP
jgi:cation-transporting ATPase E